MSIGTIFYLVALIIFFLAGIGMGIPNGTIWGLFSLTLGMLLSGVAVPVFPRP
jgi:hypothetical protein